LLEALLNSLAGTHWLAAGGAATGLSGLLAALHFRHRALAADARWRRSESLIENLAEGVYRSSLDGRQISANRALVKLNGYDTEAEILASVKQIATEWYVDPHRREAFREQLLRDGHVEDFVSEIFRHKSRERIWITESARLVRDDDTDAPLFYEGSVRDITETVKRLNLEAQFRKLTSRLPVGLFQFLRRRDGNHDVLYLSEGCPRISGIPVEEQTANPAVFTELVLAEDRDGYLSALQRSIETLAPWDCEFRIVARDGTEKWVRINALPEEQNGEITWYGYIADITLRKRQEIEIEELAYFDPLTRLPNRRLFLKRLAQSIEERRLNGCRGALLFIDLDNFKTLNDTQGHDRGDELLVQVASRLRTCVRDGDLVARLGGDEFVIILDEPDQDAASATQRAISVSNRVLAELNRGFEIGDLHHTGSASIGLVVYDGSHQRADEVLKHADIAMYQAKAAGRNGVALFDPAIMSREAERYQLLVELREALAKQQLLLHYQPQVDFNGRVVGAEALLRWNHPRLGLVRPDLFIALAEQHGLMHEVTRVVFEQGLSALARWQRQDATAHIRLSLNVGVQSFASEGFVAVVEDALRMHGIGPGRLTLELTEHVMAKDFGLVADRMNAIKRLGVRLSLDDFGTGYSSLAYLKQLPFDEVKIDGGFVTDIEDSENDRALVKTILAMARTLGLISVAEHVENVRQEAFLRAFGCDVLQGHFYSRAVPEDDFLALCGAARVEGDRQPLIA